MEVVAILMGVVSLACLCFGPFVAAAWDNVVGVGMIAGGMFLLAIAGILGTMYNLSPDRFLAEIGGNRRNCRGMPASKTR